MKILIQGLGEVPSTLEFALQKERLEITYVLCSEYQMQTVASHAGYTEKNETVVRKAAEAVGAKVVFQTCDIFDPSSVGGAIGKVLREFKPGDEIVINLYGWGGEC